MSRRALPFGACALLLLAACGGGEPAGNPDDEQAIHETLSAYVVALGEAYRGRDASALEEVAVPKEVAAVGRLIDEQAARGQYLDPVLQEMTIEDLRPWNVSNAFATTLEVWDVHLRAIGSDALVRESTGQSQRVKYQLKRLDGRWKVLFREVQNLQ
ncbi:MAG: hypothetical protein R2991_04665 [Thermoanaerobaculia bacterium]